MTRAGRPGRSCPEEAPPGLSLAWSSDRAGARLYSGDQQDFFASLADGSVDCVWTDPPYFLSNGGPTCASGRRVPVDKGTWDQSLGTAGDHAFHLAWLGACHRVLRPGGSLWVSGTLHVHPSVGFALQSLGFRLLNDIIWAKPNPPPNLGCRCFTHATEVLFWATKAPRGSRHRHTFNYDLMRARNGGRQMKNLWDDILAPGREEKRHGRHPTQKPLKLVERCLAASTQAGDLVIDPFAGSGTTGVVALTTGRRFQGCELDPRHARLAARRLADAEEATTAGEGTS